MFVAAASTGTAPTPKVVKYAQLVNNGQMRKRTRGTA
jgi:hypothetical protein